MIDNNMKSFKYVYILLLGMLVAACQTESWEASRGGLCITLGEDVSVITKSTPSELGKPVANNFTVKIVKESTGEIIYNDLYTSNTIPASVGSYSITASYGTDPVIALDSPYYKGEKSGVEVADESSTPVNLTCKVANALTSVVYGEGQVDKFNALFSTYSVEVKVGNSSVNIGKNGSVKESAYYRASSTPTFTFKGTLKENSQNVSMEITSDKLTADAFQAGKHCLLTLTLKPATAGAIITVEKVEVKNVTITETIPVEWLPKPKVNGFNDGQISLTYTTGSQSIQDVEFSFDFQDTQEKFQALNDKTFVLSQLSEEDRNLLNAASIILPNLDGSNSALFDFTAMTSNLQTLAGGLEAVNTIKVRVKANDRWSSEELTSYEIKTIKPEFSVNIYPCNIWTKEFTMNALMEEQVITGDYGKLSAGMTYQYSTNGNNGWTDIGDNLCQTDLKPGTTYYIRGLYRGEIPSEVVEVNTYPIIELENGDMEDWTLSEIGYYYNTLTWKKNPLRTYNPWIEDNQFWNTNNDFTTRHRDQWTPPFSTIYYYNSFPAVSHTKDAHSGNWAVELRNTAAGRGNTSSSKSSYDFNNVPGELFIGNINVITNGTAATPNDSYEIIKGKEFKSRPTGIKFYYKYIPYTTDSCKVQIALYDDKDRIIAENTITNGYEITNYDEVVIDFKYINDTDIVPAKIYIYFASSVYSGNSLPYHKTEVTTWYNDSQRTDETLSGSIFTIDDISLIYDK